MDAAKLGCVASDAIDLDKHPISDLYLVGIVAPAGSNNHRRSRAKQVPLTQYLRHNMWNPDKLLRLLQVGSTTSQSLQ
jgi:hypothetical protein